MRLVKVRSRQGTESLELTIPVSVAKDMDIKAGDYFEITHSKNEQVLRYRKINF